MNRFQRTFAALTASWRARGEDAPKGYTRREAEFLDAQMEIEESPPSPIARWLLWSLVAMLCAALTWSYYGRLDIVVEARGKIRPLYEVKIVQSAVSGTVTKLAVREGTEVKQGEVLIELDRVEVDAEIERLASAIIDSRLDEAATRMLAGVAGVAESQTPVLLTMTMLSDLPSELVAERQAGMSGRHGEILAQTRQKEAEMLALLASRDTQLRQARHIRNQLEGQDARNEIESRTQQLDVENQEQRKRLSEEEYARQSALLKVGTISKAQLDRSQIEMVEATRLLSAAQGRLELMGADGMTYLARLRRTLDGHMDRAAELDAQHAKVQRDDELAVEVFRRTMTDSWLEAKERLRTLDQEMVKAQRLRRDHEIVSPVAGVVQQLAVHSVGAVVKPAQPLLVVVPSNARQHAEVMVENKDVGYLVVGQEVALKLDAFPHFKHGLVRGTLLDVADDAIEDPKAGLVYLASIGLDQTSVTVDGRKVALGPGMGVTAEIRTGERALYEFFLEPLLHHKEQALDER